MNSKTRQAGRLVGASGALIAAALVYCLVQLPRVEDNATKANVKVGNLEPQVQTLTESQRELARGLGEANRRLVALGKAPVPVPTTPPATSVTPPVGVTTAQVYSIVSTAIKAYSPTLSPVQVEQIARVAAPKVPKPKDGTSPTPAQLQPVVAVAVATFCGEDRCVKQGPKGDPAPPVTDERLSALIDTSLAAYCAQHNGCVGADSTVPGPVGPTGPVGPSGPTGEQGRSVVDMDCLEDGRWRVTYDKPFPDGETVRYSRGPCRVVVVPEPTPEAKRSN